MSETLAKWSPARKPEKCEETPDVTYETRLPASLIYVILNNL